MRLILSCKTAAYERLGAKTAYVITKSRYLCSTEHTAARPSDGDRTGITMEISELQQRVDAWIKTYGVRYFSELTNMAVLTEEVGELARIMARRYGDQSAKSSDECSDERMAEEMADIIWVVTCLANQTGVNLTAAIEASFAKKTSRDRERHLNNPKLQHPSDKK